MSIGRRLSDVLEARRSRPGSSVRYTAGMGSLSVALGVFVFGNARGLPNATGLAPEMALLKWRVAAALFVAMGLAMIVLALHRARSIEVTR